MDEHVREVLKQTMPYLKRIRESNERIREIQRIREENTSPTAEAIAAAGRAAGYVVGAFLTECNALKEAVTRKDRHGLNLFQRFIIDLVNPADPRLF